MSLFNDSGAVFSEYGKYRYRLWRVWDETKPLAMFIGLNPSKANAIKPDNTVTKVGKVSKYNGFGGFYMMNLFSLISQYPEDLLTCENPIMDNDKHLKEVAELCDKVVFCWGVFKESKKRCEEIINMFPNALCFKHTKDGSPWHPLYCLDETLLIDFKAKVTK